MGSNSGPVVPFFDERIQAMTVYVLPGHHYVHDCRDTAISTLLGSCVAVCLRDRHSAIGGLNHFLLPGVEGDPSMQSARYGVYAMEMLINGVIKLGATKGNLEASVYGGASIITRAALSSVGSKNCDFVNEFLRSERIPVRASDTGGTRARRIYFFPHRAEVKVLHVNPSENNELQRQETAISRKTSNVKSGGVELF